MERTSPIYRRTHEHRSVFECQNYSRIMYRPTWIRNWLIKSNHCENLDPMTTQSTDKALAQLRRKHIRVSTAKDYQWWRHDIGALSAILALCDGNPLITGGFTYKRPAIRGDVSFVVRLSKLFNKQPRRWCWDTTTLMLTSVWYIQRIHCDHWRGEDMQFDVSHYSDVTWIWGV